ncbi:unnamed protein product [Symbiodinium natans]|uniref:Uncharacterized protein n=1 Tax=Symbiodinium natans TaxID=878477 RepID=A0A812K4W5_9DINO|nr:unnamed protein product [Symbiodinium natans]
MATALIQTNVVGPRAVKLSLAAVDADASPEAKAADRTAAAPNETAKESKQSNSSAEQEPVPTTAGSNSSAPGAKESKGSQDSKVGSNSNSTHRTPSAESSNSTEEGTKKGTEAAASKAASASEVPETTAAPAVPATPAVAKVDSSSEEAEAAQQKQAAAAAKEAASTVQGWTPDDNVSATVNYASSYDLQNSRGSVLLWTMAATYGALTVLALLIFMICADRQKHAAQLQAEKAMAARANAMPGPVL